MVMKFSDLSAKGQTFPTIVTKLKCFQQILMKGFHIKFHKNPSPESRDFTCGRKD